jgi:hypothetical protein
MFLVDFRRRDGGRPIIRTFHEHQGQAGLRPVVEAERPLPSMLTTKRATKRQVGVINYLIISNRIGKIGRFPLDRTISQMMQASAG